MPHSDPCQNTTLIIEFERNGAFHRTIVQTTDRELLVPSEEGNGIVEAREFHQRMGGDILRVVKLEYLAIDLPVGIANHQASRLAA